MSKPTVADVASVILPAGVRPDAEGIEKIQTAIDETAKDAVEGAGYVEQDDPFGLFSIHNPSD